MANVSIDKITDNPLMVMVIIYDIISQMSVEMACSVICTALDNLFASRGMTKEECVEKYAETCELAKVCYDKFGTADGR